MDDSVGFECISGCSRLESTSFKNLFKGKGLVTELLQSEILKDHQPSQPCRRQSNRIATWSLKKPAAQYQMLDIKLRSYTCIGKCTLEPSFRLKGSIREKNVACSGLRAHCQEVE
eukprot:281108-Pelagomonas_calceolata.AAC.3